LIRSPLRTPDPEEDIVLSREDSKTLGIGSFLLSQPDLHLRKFARRERLSGWPSRSPFRWSSREATKKKSW
jgi:hypothetical protein